MSNIKVLVVDDHDLFRRGLTEVLQEDPDMDVIGEARNGEEAIDLAGQLNPDLVFMDLNMPRQNGIEATAYITQNWPEMKVLILTVSEETGDLYQALSVGARGYVLKISSTDEILDALRQVHQGWVVVSPAMAPRFLSDLGHPGGNDRPEKKQRGADVDEVILTIREQEILRLVARGLSNDGIAGELMVSENTVKTHVKNILAKLHMKNRNEAANYANRTGITQVGAPRSPGK